MQRRLTRRVSVLGAAAVLAVACLAGLASAAHDTEGGAAADAGVITACRHRSTGLLRIPATGRCRVYEHKVMWNVSRPAGACRACGAERARGR